VRRAVQEARAEGIVGLAYWDNGFKVMSANKPLREPPITRASRCASSRRRCWATEMKALGAIPQVMAFSEVLPGLADRCGRRHRESAVHFYHAEDVRKCRIP
jgi:C4-dicarboxylate-binding protein DctP